MGDEHCKKLHPPSVLGDDHLVGDVLKLPPQLHILQHHPQLSLRRVAFLAPSLQLALHGAQQPGHAAFVRAGAACRCTTGVTSEVLGGQRTRLPVLLRALNLHLDKPKDWWTIFCHCHNYQAISCWVLNLLWKKQILKIAFGVLSRIFDSLIVDCCVRFLTWLKSSKTKTCSLPQVPSLFSCPFTWYCFNLYHINVAFKR